MNPVAVTETRLPLTAHWGLFWRRAYILWKGLVVYLSYKSLQWYLCLRRGLSEEAVAALWKRKDEVNAKRLYSAVVGLQGLWIKAGQYMSTRGDILPDAFILLFKRLQDSVPPKGIPETLRTIKEELKIRELQELFQTFDETPLATASIAQVHRATLLDGRQVVVKVQHANIHHKILQDLVTLKLVIRLVARFEPDFDFTPIITEWCAEVPKELDFINEAKNMAEVKTSIHAHNRDGHFTDKDDLFVDCDLPDTIWEHTTKRVLVMTFIDGYKLSDLKELTQEEINHVVKHIVRSFAYQIYVSGFFSSDPHPGNFLVAKKDGRWIPVLLDFGLTKRATRKEVMALSIILLSAANMDFTSLLSGFQELGLKVNIDNPEGSMEVIQYLFRKTGTLEEVRKETAERQKDWKKRQEDAKEKEKETGENVQRRVIDAFPGILIFFGRVLNLLRGLCVSLESRQAYMEVMVPFARHFLESTASSASLKYGRLDAAPMSHPLAQKVQAKLRQLIDEKDVVGVQVCVLQDSKTLVDVAAGVMGVFDPRPVETDSLFPVFSCSKAIAATLLNRLVDKGLVKHEDLVIKYWPDFASRISDVEGRKRKELITVAHVLSHRSGLHGAGNELLGSDPFAIADWDRMLTVMEDAIPSVEPGSETVYHSLSFGWLVGGLAEKVSGRKFSDMLDEMFKAMEITGQGYIGIPIGVETRLAAVYFEVQELFTFMEKRRDAATPSNSEATVGGDSSKPSEFETQVSKNFAALDINPLASNPSFFNQLKIRRAVIPAASGNFSARGLAGFYSHLLSGFHGSTDGYVSRATMTAMTVPQNACSIMTFGLGYRLYSFGDGHNGEDAIGGHTGFGHAGLGGSLALCDIERKVSIAIVVNKLSLFRPRATQELVGLIAKELGLGSLAQMAGSSVDMNPLASSSSEGH